MSILGKVRNAVTKADPAHLPAPLASRRSGQNGALYVTGTGGNRTDQLSAMGQNGTLFAVVDALATGVSALNWHLYVEPKPGETVKDEDREIVEPDAHAAAALWHKPNPFFTTSLLVESGQQHFELAAESVLIVSKVAGIPIELWPVRPDRMYPVPDARKYLAGWLYMTPDGEKIPFKPDEVLHQRKPDPQDAYRGLSAVQAINTDLQAGKYAAEWNRNFFLNSAQPGGVIELPTHLNDVQWDEFVKRWQEQHQGVSRAHRVAVIEHAGKYVPTSINQRDMQFSELRHDSRDTVMEAYRVSKTALGITDDVNRASALASEYQRAKTLIVPRANRWREMLNTQLLPMFGSTSEGYEFDYESPVMEDEDAENSERESKARAAQIYVNAGWNPLSVQEKLGLPEMEYGTGEKSDPDRDLLIKLVTGAPTLAELILPMLGFDMPKKEPAPLPPGAVPPAPGQPPAPTDPAAPNAPAKPPAGDDTGAAVPPKGKDPFPGNAALAHAHVHDEAALPDAVPSITPVGDAWETALDRVLQRWQNISAHQRAELRAQIIDLIDGDDIAGLAALHVGSEDAARALSESLDALARVAAAQVLADHPEVGLTAVVPDDLGAIATTVAALLAADMALAAGREALRLYVPGAAAATLAGQVITMLEQRSTASIEAQLGGALTGAQNSARVLTMASGPVGSLYADERLDKNTCKNCSAVAGRFVCTTDDLKPYDAMYTAMGGYKDCLGGVRCRGTVTGVWRPKTVPGWGEERTNG